LQAIHTFKKYNILSKVLEPEKVGGFLVFDFIKNVKISESDINIVDKSI